MAKEKTKKPRAPRQPVDRSNETKAQKFSRLASARVTKAVKAIKNIGNLSGPNYERTDEQVKAIEKHLADAVDGAMARFSAKHEKAKAETIEI